MPEEENQRLEPQAPRQGAELVAAFDEYKIVARKTVMALQGLAEVRGQLAAERAEHITTLRAIVEKQNSELASLRAFARLQGAML